MVHIVVIGGGFAGCAAAVTSARLGARVTLLEKMNSLSGLGPLTGHLITWVAREETRLMGGGGKDCIEALEKLAIFYQPEFELPQGNIIFDVTKVEETMYQVVQAAGVEIRLRSRAVDVVKKNHRVEGIILESGEIITGDAFVDATGSTGTLHECETYGQGCALCILKCPIYGSRVSIAAKAGAPDTTRDKAMYSPCIYIAPESVAPWLLKDIQSEATGYYFYPVPEELLSTDFTNHWPHPQNAPASPFSAGRSASLFPKGKILIYLIPFLKTWVNMPLRFLRSMPGFENAWLVSPLTSDGNYVKLGAVAPRDNTLKVPGIDNLFCGGERTGRIGALVECLFTGDLAAYNAVRWALGKAPIEIPSSTMVGLFTNEIKDGHTMTDFPLGRPKGQIYVEHGVEVLDNKVVYRRLSALGLVDIYARPMVQIALH
ncbi:MAG: FAD-dependent oxidoreductase [Chloroflexi bacterium]|nr:FAD-dependent oxidoreductase [Chloroflexota bacterium]